MAAKLLIVDDEESVRAALRRTLRRSSHELLFARDADDALGLLDRERVDVVVSDHLMPGMTGVELLRAVRARWPYAGRVMLTGHADLDTAMEAIRGGDIDRFLVKPWDDVELRVALDLVCEKVALEAESRRLLAALRERDEARRAGGDGERA